MGVGCGVLARAFCIAFVGTGLQCSETLLGFQSTETGCCSNHVVWSQRLFLLVVFVVGNGMCG